MAIATLTFDLENVQDRIAHMRCIKATDMANILFELRNIKRKAEHKYEDSDEAISFIFEIINEMMSDAGINIDELT